MNAPQVVNRQEIMNAPQIRIRHEIMNGPGCQAEDPRYAIMNAPQVV